MKSKLKLGGVFHMATDWEPYAERYAGSDVIAGRYRNLSESNDYVPRPESRPVTNLNSVAIVLATAYGQCSRG